jgi:hypothetical protein
MYTKKSELHTCRNYLLISKKLEDHRKAILPAVLYGCETLSPTLGKRKGGVIDNRMLKIFRA